MNKKVTISACLVVWNEEKIISQCLESIKNLVDEIIIVHDGECSDATLDIAKKYTDKVFIRPHIGEAESHRVFAMKQAVGDWIFQIDADEYLDPEASLQIRELLTNDQVDAYRFKWEMWNGRQALYFPGLEKMCFMRKSAFHYIGIPHAIGWVDGEIRRVDIFLRHRPKYDNIAWKSFWTKAKKWIPIHASYFFPELVEYECFNTQPDSWLKEVARVKANYFLSVAWYPLKNCLGQLKNGLWSNRVGITLALQQYVYYFLLYWRVWKLSKKSK